MNIRQYNNKSVCFVHQGAFRVGYTEDLSDGLSIPAAYWLMTAAFNL